MRDLRRCTVALANAVKIFSDDFSCYLYCDVEKEANGSTAPPLQVVLTGIEAYPSATAKLMVDEAGLLNVAPGHPSMQEWMGNDDNFAYILLLECLKRLVEDVLGVEVETAAPLAGCMSVGDYLDVGILQVIFM